LKINNSVRKHLERQGKDRVNNHWGKKNFEKPAKTAKEEPTGGGFKCLQLVS